jgi:hypothetical protein
MPDPRTMNTSVDVPDSDLAKIRLEHRLTVRRMVIDRVLLGLLVGLAGLVANLLVENFKTAATESQFFMQQRHIAATNFRQKFSRILSESLRQTEFPCLLDPSKRTSRSSLMEAVAAAVDQIDSSSLLFSRTYLDRVDSVLNVFGGAAAEEVVIKCEHRLFFAELADYVTHLTRQEVLLDRTSNWNGFVPEPVSREALERMGSIKYHNLNFQKWATLRKPFSDSPAPGGK